MRYCLKGFIGVWVLIGLLMLVAGCSTTGSKVGVAVAQTPIANAVLMDYIDNKPSLKEGISISHKRLTKLYVDVKRAEDADELAPWLKENWWQVKAAAVDWAVIENLVLSYANEPDAERIPDALLIYRENVRAGFSGAFSSGNAGQYGMAGLTILETLARIVAAKNGVVIP